jgi:hypothetical protein
MGKSAISFRFAAGHKMIKLLKNGKQRPTAHSAEAYPFPSWRGRRFGQKLSIESCLRAKSDHERQYSYGSATWLSRKDTIKGHEYEKLPAARQAAILPF